MLVFPAYLTIWQWGLTSPMVVVSLRLASAKNMVACVLCWFGVWFGIDVTRLGETGKRDVDWIKILQYAEG